MAQILASLSQPFTIAFAISTMLSMGLSLTVREIVAPLRNWRFVASAIGINFIVVPAAGVFLAWILGLSEDLRIGLLLVSCAAGAPLVAKLAQIAKGEVASAGGLVVLLVVVTMVFLPVALPLLLPDAEVKATAVVFALTWQMLLPLAAGLLIESRYEGKTLRRVRRVIGIISNITLVVVVVASLGQNLPGLLDLLGTGGILAVILLIAVAVVSGWLIAVPARVERRVMALAAGQRNLAAAFVVAASAFGGHTNVLTHIAASGLLMMVLLFPLAYALSRKPRGKHLGGPGASPGADVR